MATKIELLQQAGFSTEQIVDWAYKERLRQRAEGIDDRDIDRDFGVTRPPEVAQTPFLQRLKNGIVFQHMIDAAKAHWDRSMGEHPLDSALASWGFLQRFGETGKVAATAATELELASKGASGIVGGLGAAVGQGLEEALGPGGQPKGTAARDAALMAEMALMFSGAMAPARAASIGAPLRTVGRDLGKAAPKASEFQAAATSMAGNPKNAEMEQQLLQVWKEFGVHPFDIANEVYRNPAIAEAIKSKSSGLASRSAAAESRSPQVPAKSATAGEAGHAPDFPRGPHLKSSTDRAATERAVSHDGRGLDYEAAGTARDTADNGMVDIQNPPLLEQRPFHLDYPAKPHTDGSLLLPRDIEGRELHARFIAGRRTWGAADEGLGAKEINQIIRELAIRVKTMELEKGIAGRYVKFGIDSDNPFRHLHLSPELTARERDLTKAHELGHALDDFLGWASSKLVPESKEMDQLRMVYGKARKGDQTVWFTRQPESYKYTPEQVKKELFADGFRVYLGHPNFFKRVAPDAARMIRALVNDHPVLSKVIQFNSIAGAGLLGARPGHDDDGDL